MAYRQESPNCIKFGITEGCNLRCSFCGLQSIRDKPGNYKFMTVDVAEKIAGMMSRAGWNSRIEIGLFGDETANPNFVEIISIIRHHLKRNYIILMSNGLGFLKAPLDTIDAVLSAGVDTLCLDQYDGVNLIPKIRERLSADERTAAVLARHGARTFEYPADKEGNPHQRLKHGRKIVFTQDPSAATHGTHSYLHNYAGLGGPPDYSKDGRRCAKPFREIAIRFDGKMPMCCMDWRGELMLADLTQIDEIDEAWNSPLMLAIRKKLYHGQRDFGPCHGCAARSYRPGLLPDRMGKQSLPKAGVKDKELIAEALSRQPLTKPVQLPWENELPEARRSTDE